MVDLLGMFRRRPAKRKPQGFARAPGDITSLGEGFGSMVASPVRDAPPIAREAPGPRIDPSSADPRPERAPPAAEQPRPRPKAKADGASGAAQLLRRPGYLA